jgi:hypothetical protein
MWVVRNRFLMGNAGDRAREFLATFKEFPPRQQPATFTIDQAMKKMMQSLGGK